MVCAAATRAPAALPERGSEEPVSYKFDRRRTMRHAAPCWLPATFADGEGRFGITGVQVVDACPSGLGVRTTCAIEPGMVLALHPPGSRFPAVTATVVRCEQDEQGYTVGLCTRPRPNRAA